MNDTALVLNGFTCPKAFGKALRDLMAVHGESCRSLARRAGIDKGVIWRATQGFDMTASNRSKLVDALVRLGARSVEET